MYPFPFKRKTDLRKVKRLGTGLLVYINPFRFMRHGLKRGQTAWHGHTKAYINPFQFNRNTELREVY